jgi:methionine synthase I (cobalamin-dependent)/5,10-methylenetetrahydrofolate reductase
VILMEKQNFLKALTSGKPLLSDGAMGTMLHQQGVKFTGSFDLLNLTKPDIVAGVHLAYISAGSQIIQTNTFGANRFKLAQHGMDGQLKQISIAGVELAKRAVNSLGKSVFIAGDVGPLGVRIAPFGRVQLDEASSAFSEQITVLAKAGVDLIIIETMTDLYEIVAAIKAARQVAPHLPVVASMTFTRDNRTLLGDPPAKVARRIHEAGADVIGINCSGGPNQLLVILKQMKEAFPEGKYSVMPNAGWPEQVEGRIMYPAGPDYFGDYALAFWQAGASLVGGCCGTTPAHIAAMSKSIQNSPALSISQSDVRIKDTEVGINEDPLPPTDLAKKLGEGKFVVAVEMDPPRGLSTHKLLAGASLLAEAGADVIDVADSPMARMRMSPWAVCSLIQRKVGVETVLHFPTRGRNLLRVQGDLLAAHALEVRNVFVVMGDPTSIGDYPDANDNYDLVPSGLIKLIKQGFNAGFDHAGSDIGQPTQFFTGCALNLNPPNPVEEARNLHRKLKAGADFILTQPIYKSELIAKFLTLYKSEYGEVNIPLIVGLLPLASSRHAAFLQQEVPGIDIPEEVLTQMRESGENGSKKGIELTLLLVKQIKPLVQGIYLMPAFGRYDHAAEIIEKAKSL